MKLFLWYLLYYHHLFYSHISFYSKTSFIHYIHGDEAFDDDSNAIIDLLVLHDSGKKQLRVTSVRLSDIGANSCTGEEFELMFLFNFSTSPLTKRCIAWYHVLPSNFEGQGPFPQGFGPRCSHSTRQELSSANQLNIRNWTVRTKVSVA